MSAWRRFRELPLWAKLSMVAGWAVVIVLVGAFLVSANGNDGEPLKQLRLPTAIPATAASEVVVAATPPPPTKAPPPTKLPDRNDCDAMRGTDYRSPTERTWFLANCVTQEAAAPEVSSQPVPPPLPPPPQLPEADAEQQATVAQWTACSDTWWEGAAIEVQLDLAKLLGSETSYLETQYQGLQQYLASNCVGIGTRLASVAGSGQWCFDSLSVATTISLAIQTAQLTGGGTYFLQFGKQEVDSFLAAAGC